MKTLKHFNEYIEELNLFFKRMENNEFLLNNDAVNYFKFIDFIYTDKDFEVLQPCKDELSDLKYFSQNLEQLLAELNTNHKKAKVVLREIRKANILPDEIPDELFIKSAKKRDLKSQEIHIYCLIRNVIETFFNAMAKVLNVNLNQIDNDFINYIKRINEGYDLTKITEHGKTISQPMHLADLFIDLQVETYGYGERSKLVAGFNAYFGKDIKFNSVKDAFNTRKDTRTPDPNKFI